MVMYSNIYKCVDFSMVNQTKMTSKLIIVFKPANFVYKFIDFQKYFAPYISSYSSSYSARHSQSGGNFFVVPKFQPSIHKSVTQFDYSLLLMLHFLESSS